jgi:hypothetical protein
LISTRPPRSCAASYRNPCRVWDPGVPAPDRKHPTTYIVCEQDNAIPVAAQEQMAAAADRVERLPSSHQPMASMPDKLAEVLARVR